jgi:photosystem II stability/assembly factor-like uncharacterized protein
MALCAAALLAVLALSHPALSQVPEDEITVNAFSFADDQHGLAVGEAGLILSTDDGGLSWRRRALSVTAPLLAVAHADPRVAYAVGGSNLGAGGGSIGLILKTADGGLSWQTVGKAGPCNWGVAASGRSVMVWRQPDSETPSGLLLSCDAGKSWQVLNGRLAALPLAVHWSDQDSGLLVAADGTGWRWGKKEKEGKEEKDQVTLLESQTPAGHAVSATIIDPQTWIVALETGDLVRTADSGHTWRPVAADGPAGGSGVRAFSFLSPTEGWFAGVGPGGIQYTTDGGRKWKRTGPSPAGPLRAVHFADSWNGVAAGPFGTIYRTTDGGGAWTCVRGAPRRAALWVTAPWNSAGDWPLVSMLCGDRGYRTLLWAVTNPSGEPLVVAERHLRDAAWALTGVEALVLARVGSTRIDAAPGFELPAAMPHGAFAGGDPSGTAAVLAEAVRRWRPVVVLSPSPKAEDAEEAFAGRVAEMATAAENRPAAAAVRRWIADPRNETGSRLPMADSEYEIAVNPLAPSENFGICHAVRGLMAAELVRLWPAPLAEALGYTRPGAKKPAREPLALLADLGQADAETRRSVGPAAPISLEQRMGWEHETREFYQQWRANLSRGDFGAALRLAGALDQVQSELQLPQVCLAELGRRAAIGGDRAVTEQALTAVLALGHPWGPRSTQCLLWLLDRQSSVEWSAGEMAPELPSRRPAPPANYAALLAALDQAASGLVQQPALAYQGYRYLAMRANVDSEALARIRRTLANSPELQPDSEIAADGILNQEVKLETWVQSGRQGEAPLAAVRLEMVKSGESGSGQPVDLGAGLNFKVRERTDGLILTFEAKTAKNWWITIDMDRDGRTWLAEPLTDEAPPAVTFLATAAAPLWVRHPGLWTREEKDGQLAVFFSYASLGGRPQRGTVWMVTLRKRILDGLRPAPPANLKNSGCFAVRFD